MADTDFTGLECECEDERWIRYSGTKAAFLASGMVPEGVEFPGERTGKKAAPFLNSEGKKCTFRKGYKGLIYFTVWRSERDALMYRRRRERQEDIYRLEVNAQNLSTSETALRKRAVGELNSGFNAMIMEMFRETPAGEKLPVKNAWYFPKSAQDEMQGLYLKLRAVIEESTLLRDDPPKMQIEKLKAAVADDAFQHFLGRVLINQ